MIMRFSGSIRLSDLSQLGYKDACKIWKTFIKLVQQTPKN